MVAAFISFRLWLFSCLALVSLAMAQQPHHFIYNHGFRHANLHRDGSAEIRSNGLLRLTTSSVMQIGHAFYPSPINFNTSSSSSTSLPSLSFSTNFVLAIVPGPRDATGHGIAFVISQSTDFSHAAPIQYLGLVDESTNGNSSNHFFAVEFDTINSIDMGDIDDNHVGIDLNGVKSNKQVTARYFSNEERRNISLNLKSGHPIQVWIDYNGHQQLLNVTLAPDNVPKPNPPLLSTSIDLSDILMDTMYVGFSAATGSIQSTSSSHYILGWSFNRSGEAQSLEVSEMPKLPKNGGRSNTVRLISIIAAVLLLLVIIGATYVYRRKKYEEVHEDWEKEYGPHRFSYKTLYIATKGFKDKQLLGFGGFGKVYKGTLPYTNEGIAVKKVSHESNQGMKEFVSEIVSMGKLRHKKLVPLLGYCRRKKELLLVYEHMKNGSLDKFLFSVHKPTLNWFQRFQIIKGVASALLYLHEEGEQVVLHRDIKASNVLLDSDLNGRLGDFGLARLYDRNGDPQTTRLVGTLGYMDPELTRIGRATKAADVFSFGAFMLEVACGRKPFDPNKPPEDLFLVDVVNRSFKRDAIVDAVDPRLHGNYVVEEMERVVKLGMLCSNTKSDLRPTIKQVVQYLEGDATLPVIPLDSIPQNISSSILEIVPQNTEINISTANNLASDSVFSFSSSVGKGLSLNSLSSTDSVLHIGR
ncbi:putative L-type lectin-domain containing receptor kinase I.11 [Hibiscus syriacus]|uniref:non-specific serine/threonine protein kinase n=1 Tax=Hibiscus syriacus TaxID=106335 RepID=A0A6A2Z9L0_HIBSY|nr:L-type lectin-domain containing receptor kinase SIT1-like [Hibiscus syriacus]KAE8688681.1 putative L-type lectin-domain containing receptor kinase I.11 [Hibiscus syriacus]